VQGERILLICNIGFQTKWTYWVFEEKYNMNNVKRKNFLMQNIWHLWDQILKLCAGFFLRFQVSKVSLTKHLSNETKYGQKSWADLDINSLEKKINNFWQRYFTASTLNTDNLTSPSFPRYFSRLLPWLRLSLKARALKYQRILKSTDFIRKNPRFLMAFAFPYFICSVLWY
jgi:hypothetical protein